MTASEAESLRLAPVVINVAVDTPQYADISSVLSYQSEQELAPGTLVTVPLGKRELAGIVWGGPVTELDAGALRPISQVLAALPPLAPRWLELIEFAAAYYQRGIGEMALTVLPPELRKLDDLALARRMKRWLAPPDKTSSSDAGDSTQRAAPDAAEAAVAKPTLSDQQTAALATIAQAGASTTLVYGATGSGKTEVYLRAVDAALQAGQQALVMVPEINLTPQLEARFGERFPGRVLVALHSRLTPAQRLRHWLLAHLGHAHIVLGTRLAVFASMPQLGLIVVDEEHDPSFKQQEGARYSARDLAVYRGHLEGIPVLLGSATPSLETWQRVIDKRYALAAMPQRVGQGAMPRVRLVDMRAVPQQRGAPAVLAPALLQAITERIARGEQSLVLLNRRGYAPVLHCSACDWKSGCSHCSAWRVFHKGDRTLRCHHCGFTERVPRACPECGNLDISPMGRGTEKLEEQLAELLPTARIARIDADSTRLQGALQEQLAAVHAGEVDVLVGTQIVAKGHDFRRMTLVAAVNPDGALFSADFRAPERLFALLMQSAGRAGRDAEQAARSEMWVQTSNPQHPMYAALRAHDFAAFATQSLNERRASALPPFTYLALLRAEAAKADVALAFLQSATDLAASMAEAQAVTIYPGVPNAILRVADVDRVQMLLEAVSRPALQRFLSAWLPQLHALRAQHKGLKRWAVDVDPMAI